jgi:uncharacterized membrane protein
MATGIVTTMNNAEDRILRVWTPILLRAILAAAVTLLTVGLLVSVMHSSNDYSSALQAIRENSAAAHPPAASVLTLAATGNAIAILTLGLFVLTLVPLARVSFCFLLFLKQKSLIFASFTAYVLAGLVVGILLGRIG